MVGHIATCSVMKAVAPSPYPARATLRGRPEAARAGDGPAIAALLATPMPGRIRLALVTDPTFCEPREDLKHRHHAVVVRDGTAEILAHGARTVRRQWLAGEPRWCGYLHGLRRVDALAGDGRRLAQALRHLQATHRTDEADHDLTAILSTNRQARRVLAGGLPGAPLYHEVGTYHTWVVDAASWRCNNPSFRVRPCPPEARGALHDLLATARQDHATVWNANATGWHTAWRGDTLVACARLVDRRSERQERVVGYDPWMARLRPLANLLALFTRKPRLLPPGSHLDLVYVAGVAGDPSALPALLASLSNEARLHKARLLGLGFAAGHLWQTALKSVPAWHIESCLYAVAETAPSLRLPSPELAWL